jgi:tetratricopeptide (TPR) repeat protein
MRIGVSLLAIALCLFLIQAAARFGFSRLLSRYALITHSTSVADNAVRISPSDPDAQRARASAYNYEQRHEEAASSLESAVARRYRDDYLWIELGNTREEVGDTNGALAALDQAVRWAPYYAHTHWQRGNLLLRMNRSNEAFTDLRQAAAANQKYLPNLIDLAWGISKGELKTTEALVVIDNDSKRLALIRYLAGKGKGKETLEQIHLLTTPLSPENNREFARLLFAAKSFRESFALSHSSAAVPYSWPSFVNPGFEEALLLNDVTFGWIVAPEHKNHLAIDVSEKIAGAKSLQITLDGNWAVGTALLSQTLVLEPEKGYRISFAVKTKDVVTGGPPFIAVRDASNNQLLGRSENFPTATSPWLTLKFEFTTQRNSQAAVVRLERNNCDATCLIFGTLWLDQFRIEQTDPPVTQ